MEAAYWKVDEHKPLTPAVRSWLLATYGYAAPAEHTYGALISIILESSSGVRCLDTFPFTFVLATALTGSTENAITAAAQSRMTTLRNADPLSTILDRRHWL